MFIECDCRKGILGQCDPWQSLESFHPGRSALLLDAGAGRSGRSSMQRHRVTTGKCDSKTFIYDII